MLLGRTRCRWEDNIKVGLQEIGWGGMYSTDVAHQRDMWQALVSVVVDCQVL
jgi:hypothetical protein